MIALITVMFITSIIEHKMGLNGIATWHYNNPLIILLSAVVFCLFKNWNFKNKLINELAKATLHVFYFMVF